MLPSVAVGGLKIYPYSILMILGAGVFIGLFCLRTIQRHRDTPDENAFAIEMLLISVAAALPAAMLFDSLFQWGIKGRFEWGGATYYGGLLAALATYPLLLLFKKKRAVSILERLNDLAYAIPAGHALGRLGCFCGGCCFGRPTDSVFGVRFPEGSLPYAFYGESVKIHPVQLYEAVFLVGLFCVLFFVGKNDSFSLYLICYPLWRFCIEFLRADERGTLFGLGLSPAQIISIGLLLLGIVLLVLGWTKRKKALDKQTE